MTFNGTTEAGQERMSAWLSRTIPACHVLIGLRIDPGEVSDLPRLTAFSGSPNI